MHLRWQLFLSRGSFPCLGWAPWQRNPSPGGERWTCRGVSFSRLAPFGSIPRGMIDKPAQRNSGQRWSAFGQSCEGTLPTARRVKGRPRAQAAHSSRRWARCGCQARSTLLCNVRHHRTHARTRKSVPYCPETVKCRHADWAPSLVLCGVGRAPEGLALRAGARRQQKGVDCLVERTTGDEAGTLPGSTTGHCSLARESSTNAIARGAPWSDRPKVRQASAA
jgi:hypothetical protein